MEPGVAVSKEDSCPVQSRGVGLFDLCIDVHGNHPYDAGIMGSEMAKDFSGAWSQDRASALELLEPGL